MMSSALVSAYKLPALPKGDRTASTRTTRSLIADSY
ncbi:unannotated protein [freshwater metagenome]|uniref:Unannotated protein n=1 Tax=freshwater metagenome TaxID=449393 RepID=A0A6J6BRX8_9ZZZZ